MYDVLLIEIVAGDETVQAEDGTAQIGAETQDKTMYFYEGSRVCIYTHARTRAQACTHARTCTHTLTPPPPPPPPPHPTTPTHTIHTP